MLTVGSRHLRSHGNPFTQETLHVQSTFGRLELESPVARLHTICCSNSVVVCTLTSDEVPKRCIQANDSLRRSDSHLWPSPPPPFSQAASMRLAFRRLFDSDHRRVCLRFSSHRMPVCATSVCGASATPSSVRLVGSANFFTFQWSRPVPARLKQSSVQSSSAV